MKAVILAGGLGTRIPEETHLKPKPMIEVGGKQFNGKDLCSAFNFGPATDAAATVKDAIELARTAYGAGVVNHEDRSDGPHEAGMLALEAAKARVLLGITPQWSLAETVQRTMAWYHAQHQGADARTLCEAEIADYEVLL